MRIQKTILILTLILIYSCISKSKENNVENNQMELSPDSEEKSSIESVKNNDFLEISIDTLWNNLIFKKGGCLTGGQYVYNDKFGSEGCVMSNSEDWEIFFNKDIKIINNGVNTTLFKNDDLLGSNEQIILYFGTLIRKKGVFELVEIFNKVCEVNSKAKLVLIGKDSGDITTNSKSTWELMKPLFSNASINNVSYLGKVSYDVMNEYINKATICVFPSFAEALPVSWLEAMAMKKAIVASNIGWGKEIIEDGKNGFLVDPKNHALYAEKILSLLADSNLRLKIGDEARKKIENCFDINTVVDQNIEFYNIFKR